MPKPSFTAKQRQAIETRDKTLLVSAAAGSGKTATLIERIIQSLIDEKNPENINDMLIVTFTVAAASELREKVSRALKNQIELDPTNERLKKQLHLLPGAKISTIDSFYNDILRNCAHLFGLNPNYRIADSTECELLSKQIWEGIIESAYSGEFDSEMEPGIFLKFAASVIENKTDRLEDVLVLLYNKTRQLIPGIEFYKHISQKYAEYAKNPLSNNPFADFADKELKSAAEYCINLTEYALQNCFDENCKTHLPYINAFTDDLKMFGELRENGIKTRIKKFLFSSTKGGRGGDSQESVNYAKSIREKTKAVAKKAENYLSYTEEEWSECFSAMSRMTECIYVLMKKFHSAFMAQKRERGFLEHDDIQRYTYMALISPDGKRTELAESLRRQYSSVYIDEYQDVNYIQNEIFSAVSTERNRFMVGDIKQSIYGFRGGKPEIFENYKNSFTPIDKSGADTDSAVIFMSNNFRCDKGIIDFTNEIFDTVFAMCGESIGYTAQDRLIYSKSETDEVRDVEICLFTKYANELLYGGTAEAQAEDETLYDDTDLSEYDPLPDDIKKDELDALWTAKKIRSLLDTGTLLNSGEPVRPKDIAILLRKDTGKCKIYRDALLKEGILAKLPASKDFLETDEIMLVLCLLNSIDNPRSDIYLTGLLRSPLYDFSLDLIYKIRSESRKKYLYDSLLEYSENHPESEKCNSFIRDLTRYRRIAEGSPVDILIMQLYKETGLISLAEKNGFKENLFVLYNYARNYESSSFKGLYNFVNYINAIIKDRAQFPTNKTDNDENAVTITTIHKSKGLEYPIVFIGDIGCEIRSATQQTTPVQFDENMGVIFQIKSDEYPVKIKYPQYHIISDFIGEKEFDESMRVYYVALTRARERLYLVGHTSDRSFGEFEEDAEFDRKFLTSFSARKAKTVIKLFMMTGAKAVVLSEEEETEKLIKSLTERENHTPPLSRDLLSRDSTNAPNDGEEQESAAEYSRQPNTDGQSGDSDTGKEKEKTDTVGENRETDTVGENEKHDTDKSTPARRTDTAEATAAHGVEPVSADKAISRSAKIPTDAAVHSGEGEENGDTPLYRALTERFNYLYPKKHLTTLPEKMLVSKMTPGILEDIEDTENYKGEAEILISDKLGVLPEFIGGKSEASSTRRGIATHYFMQFADFLSLQKTSVEDELERLCREGFISKENAALVRTEELRMFVKSDFFKELLSAEKLYRELRFNIMLPAVLFTEKEEKKKALKNEQILVQGVIDCIILDGDGEYHLIDYKTDRLTKKQLEDRTLAEEELNGKHALQLTYYALAVEKLFGKLPKTVRVYSLHLGDTVNITLHSAIDVLG